MRKTSRSSHLKNSENGIHTCPAVELQSLKSMTSNTWQKVTVKFRRFSIFDNGSFLYKKSTLHTVLYLSGNSVTTCKFPLHALITTFKFTLHAVVTTCKGILHALVTTFEFTLHRLLHANSLYMHLLQHATSLYMQLVTTCKFTPYTSVEICKTEIGV